MSHTQRLELWKEGYWSNFCYACPQSGSYPYAKVPMWTYKLCLPMLWQD